MLKNKPKTPVPKAPVLDLAHDDEVDASDTHAPTCGSKRGAVPGDATEPPPPRDSEVKKAADSLAQEVATLGLQVEETTRIRNRGNPKYRFLLEEGTPDHRYYLWKKDLFSGKFAELAPVRPAPSEASRNLGSLGAPPKRSRFDDPPPTVNADGGGGGSSLRAHHLDHYIPQEDYDKFLQGKSGSTMPQGQKLDESNVGHRMLKKMGWNDGRGLGAQAAGATEPVAATGSFKQAGDNRGLGAGETWQVKEGDDQFEVFRKRMMLGYKHRPNPFNNPRHAYY